MNTIEKTLAILEEIIDNQAKGISLSEIVRKQNLPLSSTHRILQTLLKMGYIIFERDTKKYRGSLKLSKLGAQVIESLDLQYLVRPYLERLHENTGHTCHLGIFNDNRGIYILKVESKSFGISLYSGIGKEFPLHCTALGKALLAFMPPENRSEILRGPLPVFTEKTITTPKTLELELNQIRKEGHSIDNEEITRGIVCVAAPLKDYANRVLAAISVTFPSFLKKEREFKRTIKSVRDCADEISQTMGYDAGKLLTPFTK